MSGETLAVLLAAAVGIGLALAIERRRQGEAAAAARARYAFPDPLGYSAFSGIPVATVPSSPSTWALIL